MRKSVTYNEGDDDDDDDVLILKPELDTVIFFSQVRG